MKKFVAIMVSVIMMFAVASVATACGDSKTDNYFKAVSCDLSDYVASGYSGSDEGVRAIFGGNDITDNSLRNSIRGDKYFVATFCGDRSILVFEITASKAETGCEMYFSLSSENGTLDMTWQGYNVTVNDKQQEFKAFTLTGSATTGAFVPFVEKSMGKIDLIEGKNTIIIKPGNNTWGPHEAAGGPGLDYIKIKSSATLKLVYDYWPDNKLELGV